MHVYNVHLIFFAAAGTPAQLGMGDVLSFLRVMHGFSLEHFIVTVSCHGVPGCWRY